MISELEAVLYLMNVCSKQVETLPKYYTTSRDFVEDPILCNHIITTDVKTKDDD